MVASTFDMENMRLVDSGVGNGPKFVTFAHILKYDTFPLASIVRRLLEIAREEMRCDVEIEFAAELTPADTDELRGRALFNVLQIRPISSDGATTDVDWDKVDCSSPIVLSSSALGTGFTEGVQDVIYLRPEAFDNLHTQEIATEIATLNAKMRAENCGYVLIGYGRWGSSIPSLGVPVKWGDISEVKAVVECALDSFRPDPSQGSHFFQNMTSFNVGYVSVDRYSRPGDLFDIEKLDSMPALYESRYVRRVKFPSPLTICIDGRSCKALVKA
jgi:hypothetical protein